MNHVVLAEWKKVWRRGMVLGGVGVMVGLALLAVSIRFFNAEEGAPPGEGQAQNDGPPIFSREELEGSKGPILSLIGFSGNLIGVVSLVMFAQSVGGEYGWGTLRVMLAREPRRLMFLGGKFVAMTGFVGIGVAAAWIVQTLAAILFALILGIDMDAWWTGEGLGESVAAFLRVWFTATIWGLFGAALAMAFRSAAPAIGVGIGYTILGEPLLTLAWDDGTKWLPGSLLSVVNLGIGDPVSVPLATLLLVGYAALFLATCGTLFRLRDVSS